MSTSAWAEVDEWARQQPAPIVRGGVVSLQAPGWYAFAKLTDGSARFRAHALDPRIVLQVPCGFRPGAWRQHDVVRRTERPFLTRAIPGPVAEPHASGIRQSCPLPVRTWEQVLVALDSWFERGCPPGRSPVLVELLP